MVKDAAPFLIFTNLDAAEHECECRVRRKSSRFLGKWKVVTRNDLERRN